MTTVAYPGLRLPSRTSANPGLLGLLTSRGLRPSAVLLASTLIPGLGSALNGDPRRGLALFAGFVAAALMLVGGFGVLGIVLMFAIWLLGLIDAHDGATGWDEHTR